MKKILSILFVLTISAALSYTGGCRTLKVFQLNLWGATTNVPGGEAGAADVLAWTDADIVLLCEATAGKDTSLVSRLARDLSERGLEYHVHGSGHPVCMLTKTEPESVEWTCIVPGNEERAILKVTLEIGGRQFAVYSAHLDHRHYGCYLPRGYSGTTWKKLGTPVTDESSILESNRESYRDESIRAFLAEARKDIAAGRTVILGGDFNEPSHLDWGENTADLYDHNGAVIQWDCSTLLEKAGFRDVYRAVWPDPLENPGFTYPSNNPALAPERLTWAPEADERDRIDFIYILGNCLIPSSAEIYGPSSSIVRCSAVEESGNDIFITPAGTWPSDHKGVFAKIVVSK